jgi:hypothetical protein
VLILTERSCEFSLPLVHLPSFMWRYTSNICPLPPGPYLTIPELAPLCLWKIGLITHLNVPVEHDTLPPYVRPVVLAF